MCVSFLLSVIFFIYPEILLSIFNVINPYHAEVVTLAIRITAFSLVGRCMSYLLANYAQAIEQNKISSIITFLEEFLFAVAGALILTRMTGGIGIWISILFAECAPVVVYIILTLRVQKNNKNKINRLLMLQNSKLITWTYSIEDVGNVDKYLDEQSGEILLHIENLFKDNAILISNSMDDICNDIFESTSIRDIDVTIRLIDDELYIVLTTDGRLYNPFSNEDLVKSDNIEKLSELNCRFDYDDILGFNKSYVIFKN